MNSLQPNTQIRVNKVDIRLMTWNITTVPRLISESNLQRVIQLYMTVNKWIYSTYTF
jgi:hypothetical protein